MEGEAPEQPQKSESKPEIREAKTLQGEIVDLSPRLGEEGVKVVDKDGKEIEVKGEFVDIRHGDGFIKVTRNIQPHKKL